MGGLFGSPKQPALPPIPPPPGRSDADIQADASAERRQRTLARGRASSILTKKDETTGASAKKVLLGSR